MSWRSCPYRASRAVPTNLYCGNVDCATFARPKMRCPTFFHITLHVRPLIIYAFYYMFAAAPGGLKNGNGSDTYKIGFGCRLLPHFKSDLIRIRISSDTNTKRRVRIQIRNRIFTRLNSKCILLIKLNLYE